MFQRGLDKYDVVATYTITAREDYKCTQSTDYTLTVERDKIYCCPIDPDHMGGIHTGYDYGKGYKFTWPATSINPAKAGESGRGTALNQTRHVHIRRHWSMVVILPRQSICRRPTPTHALPEVMLPPQQTKMPVPTALTPFPITWMFIGQEMIHPN